MTAGVPERAAQATTASDLMARYEAAELLRTLVKVGGQLLLFFTLFTIARWRVVGLVIGVLWVGAILLGSLYNLLI